MEIIEMNMKNILCITILIGACLEDSQATRLQLRGRSSGGDDSKQSASSLNFNKPEALTLDNILDKQKINRLLMNFGATFSNFDEMFAYFDESDNDLGEMMDTFENPYFDFSDFDWIQGEAEDVVENETEVDEAEVSDEDDNETQRENQLDGAEQNQPEFTRIISGPYAGPSVPFFNDPSHPIVQGTQKAEYAGRIIGGRDSTRGDEFSHFASLLYWDRQELQWKWAGCGATVISDCYVLTAAHCVLNPYTPIAGIFINALSPYNGNNGEEFHFSFPQGFTIHPDYDDFSNKGDIALIKLQTCVDTTKFPTADPAPESYNINDGSMVKIMGFGRTGDEDPLPSVLQQASLPYITEKTCRDEYYGRYVLEDMVCAGFDSGGVDACQGDSGSGLVRSNPDGRYTHLGIVSWGIGCGKAKAPGVYISVSYYYKWIESIVCEDPTSTDKQWCYN